MAQRFWLFFFIGSITFFLANFSYSLGFAQTPFYGPPPPPKFSGPPPTAIHKIKVQVLIYDQPELGGKKIESVSFNGKNIPLQPPDLKGFRGGGGFQLEPGSYRLEWRISGNPSGWPRSLGFEQAIKINENDTWVQVTIQGDKATLL